MARIGQARRRRSVSVVVMIPLQAAVFILSPPPTTVEAYFALFQENPLLGLLDLDVLLTLDYLVMVPFYLALYVVVRLAPRGRCWHLSSACSASCSSSSPATRPSLCGC